jgi:death on curing protein
MNEERVEPIWIADEVAFAVHDRQLAEHGGATGLRDQGALLSALARPRNQWAYGNDDICDLAASYAYGVARNHPFTDGNKRTAFVLALIFLTRNGIKLAFDKADAIRTFLALAAGELSEDELADWFRQRVVAA